MHLGSFHYPQPVIVLAPMAGVSDLPFRRLCQENGADYSTAEMISAKPELLHTACSATRLQFDPDPRYPKIIQLVGGDAALMAEAALLMQVKGADIIETWAARQKPSPANRQDRRSWPTSARWRKSSPPWCARSTSR